MSKALKTFGIEVTLTADQLRSICDKINSPLNPTEKLSGIATGALQDLADGGMMIEPQAMTRIRKITGPVEGGLDLVSWVEAGQHRDGDRIILRWAMDPTFKPLLEEIAHVQGTTIEALIQDGITYIVQQGWLYQLNPPPRQVIISQSDCALMAEILGKPDWTGTDLADYVRKTAEMPVGA